MMLVGKVVLIGNTKEVVNMTKYKLYTFSGAMYVVPLDKCEYVDNTVGRYFEDYCEGLHK